MAIDTIKTLKCAEDAPENPYTVFAAWLALAEQSEPNDPNAMCLATIGADGRPQARIVLLKDWDERGFVFYTNMKSRKGDALLKNPFVALNFHWKSLGRAVRIEGRTEKVSDAESDAYFATRSRGSKTGAWASQQSQTLAGRSTLQEAVSAIDAQYTDTAEIPRPPHWYGTRVIPDRIEFWHDGEFRLHTRLVYMQNNGESWVKQMLYP